MSLDTITQKLINYHAKQLEHIEENYKKSGAWLIYGIKGIGKLATLKYFATKTVDPRDALVIENNNIKIKNIRNLIEFAISTPLHSKNKIIILDVSLGITEEASNALLKILEEPPVTTFIFIVSDYIHKILPTIISRCHVIYFKPIKMKDSGLTTLAMGSYGKFKEMKESKSIEIYKSYIKMLQKKLSSEKNKIEYQWSYYLIQVAICRIMQYKSGVILQEIYKGEEMEISKISGNVNYWHKKWISIMELINIPNIDLQVVSSIIFTDDLENISIK